MPQMRRVKLLLFFSSVAISSGSEWTAHRHRNTYEGNGAGTVVGQEQYIIVAHEQACQGRCGAFSLCDCVVFATWSKKCWLRSDCKPEHFVHDAAFDVYMKPADYNPAAAGDVTSTAKNGWWVAHDEPTTTTKVTTTTQATTSWAPPAFNKQKVSCSSTCKARYKRAEFCEGLYKHFGQRRGGCEWTGTQSECFSSCDDADYGGQLELKTTQGKESETLSCRYGCKHRQNDELKATTTVHALRAGECPPGYLKSPKNLVNVTLGVENVNYDWLIAFPALQKAFVTAIKRSIVTHAGDSTRAECIDVELSEGSVDVLAMVRPQSVHSEKVEEQLGDVGSGSANALAIKLRDAPLKETVSKNVDGVVSQTGVTTGEVHIKDVKVRSEADSQSASGGGGGSWWWLLWLLLLLLCCGCCGGAALYAKKEGLLPLEQHKNKLKGPWRKLADTKLPFVGKRDKTRTLVPNSDPEDNKMANNTPSRNTNSALRVHFLDQNGVRRIFCFKSQPLGIVISQTETNTVQGFHQDSYAKEKGVKAGWQVVQVAEKMVTSTSDPGQVRKILDFESEGLAPYATSPKGPKDIKVHFLDHQGDTRVFRFKSSPLGLVMDDGDASLVKGFLIGSYAKEKGVSTGWRVTQVASELVYKESCKAGDVQRLLKENGQGLEQWPFKIEFDTGTGEARTILFREGPLGMAFFNKLPLCIEDFKSTSVAKEMGVQKGWTLTKIGDVDVRTEPSFAKVAGYIKEGIEQLPSRNGVQG